MVTEAIVLVDCELELSWELSDDTHVWMYWTLEKSLVVAKNEKRTNRVLIRKKRLLNDSSS
jgi:hypothetical protein